MAAPEPTLAGRLDPVLQGTWRRLGARPAPYLDLKIACRDTRSVGYRQGPSSPHRERLRTRSWDQLFGAPLDYLEFFAWQRCGLD
jgi:hypothetical protein